MNRLPKEWKKIFSKFSEKPDNRNLIFFLHFYKKELYGEDKVDGISIFDPLYKNETVFEEMNLPVIPLGEFSYYFMSRTIYSSRDNIFNIFNTFNNETCQYGMMVDVKFLINNFSKFKYKNIWIELVEGEDNNDLLHGFILHLDFGKEKGYYTMVPGYRHFINQIEDAREKFGSELICQFAKLYFKYLKSFCLNNEEDWKYFMEKLTEEEKLYLECSGL